MSNIAKDEILSISSGTIAALTGETKYEKISEIQRKWYQWTFSMETCGIMSFCNWMQTWKEYRKSLELKYTI